MKNILIVLLVLTIGVGAYMFIYKAPKSAPVATTQEETPQKTETTPQKPVVNTPLVVDKTKTVLGSSVEGNPITAYHYGEGDTELLFVGGIHGGYEWNTTLVAYELMDYLQSNPTTIPKNIKVTVIPTLNPDGLKKVTGKTGRFIASDVSSSEVTVVAGRFNANTVDLNRNFDCDWKTEGVWQTKKVSGGTAPFSEPESKAMKTYIEAHKPQAVLAWYSSAGGVYASNCHNKSVLPETATIMKKFATASGYPAHESFDFYATTGDMMNWLAKNNIPAISVLLTNHTDTEWSKNKAGVLALLKHYTK